MRGSFIVRRVLQGVALLIGLLGLLSIYMGLKFGISGFRESENFAFLLFDFIFIAFGAAGVWVGWSNLRSFGPQSINNMLFLIAIFSFDQIEKVVRPIALALYPMVPERWRPIEGVDGYTMRNLYEGAPGLVALILACFLYKILSWILIKVTVEQDVPVALEAK